MPYVINRQAVPEELILQEEQRIGRDPRWASIPEEPERARQLRAAAEHAAVDKVLIELAAASDPRPVDAVEIEQEVQRQKAAAGCRSAFDDSRVRQWVEQQFRVQRTIQGMVAEAPKPSFEEISGFYEANRANFRNPAMYHVAHIVKHVTEDQSEEQALAGIEAALADLERGGLFAEVAERHSDCKGSGGDLGQFPAGHMVQDFDDAIRDLQPGQRTGIFTTPFGYHIAELRAKTSAGPAAFEEVQADIERVLAFSNQLQAYTRAVAQLRSRASITQAPSRAVN